MKKIALIFAGQGSQYQGMGLDFFEAYPFLSDLETEASELLGFDVRKILLSTDGKMNETKYTQGLVLLSSIYAFEVFQTLGIHVFAMAGFSLGEYSALYASKVFDFNQIIQIVAKRSQLMQECSIKHPGKMAAIIGLSSDEINQICKDASHLGVVVPANYNAPIQIVISGEDQAVNYASELAKQRGAKRAMILNVSGAFHSPLMKEAGHQLATFLKQVTYQEPQCLLYMNATAQPLIIEELLMQMENQLQSSVFFEQTIKHMVEDGITHFIEIGPGTVLSGLIKKIDINIEVAHLGKMSDLDLLKGWLKEHGFNK